MTTRWARIARGTSAALVATFVAVFFHGIAGGPVPALPGLIACVVFSTLVSIPLAGATLSRVRLAAAVTLSQIVFHFAFVVFAGVPFAGGGGGHVHAHTAQQVAAQLASLEPVTAHVHDSPMWFAHAAASLITYLLVRHGEKAILELWSAAELTLRALRFALPQAAPVSATLLSAPHRGDERPRAARILFSVLHYRGPPASSLA